MVDSETEKVLFIKVHRGKGLAAMDDGVSSDPYAEITIGNHSCKTKVRTLPRVTHKRRSLRSPLQKSSFHALTPRRMRPCESLLLSVA